MRRGWWVVRPIYSAQRHSMASKDLGGTASGESVARRKRPWRKPREAKGPGEYLHGGSTSFVPSATTSLAHTDVEKRKRDEVSGVEGQEPVQQVEPMEVHEVAGCGDGDAGGEGGGGGGEGGGGGGEGGGGGGGEGGGSGGGAFDQRILDIDGSVMEGGGQILRNAMTFSCLLNQPIHINRIRAGRDKPGLRPQHLTGIQLIAELCDGRLTGDAPGSSEVTFEPATIRAGSYFADTQTAGSIVLLLQAILPCLLFAPGDTSLVLRGGTNADMAPPIDYMISVFKPMAERFGVKFDQTIVKKGFYPRGGGEVRVTVHPVRSLSAVNLLDRGEVAKVSVEVFTAGAVRAKYGHQMAGAAKQLLTKKLPSVPVTVNTVHLSNEKAFSNGSGIMIVATTTTGCLLGGSANGRRGEAAEVTGRKAAEEVIRNIEAGGCVDEHLQDQLVVLMALARGQSAVRTGPVTEHTRTAIHIAELVTKAKFTVRAVEDTPECHIIECTGIGLEQ